MVDRGLRVGRSRSSVGDREAFGALNPQFSAAGDLEAARQRVAEIRAFNAAYDVALERWTSGNRRHAVFPHGTWWM